MSTVYVDTSVLAAIAFDERGAAAHAQVLQGFSRMVSSTLLEAELRSVFARENLAFQERVIAGVDWILPARRLAPEFTTVLETGYLRGADLLHVATALYALPQAGSLSFATLDNQQSTVAKALGFPVPWKASSP